MTDDEIQSLIEGCIIQSSIVVKNLDHLGIVVGIVDELGVVESVNEYLGEDPHEKVNAGIAVKAMILNGLGFASAPLYLFEQFFVGKPTEHLLGPGVLPQYLNDYRLGRVLDGLYLTGITTVFLTICMEAGKRFNISYHIQATLSLDPEADTKQKRRAGHFILATNVLHSPELERDESDNTLTSPELERDESDLFSSPCLLTLSPVS
ncbi:MAG: DUF4277 domain-containing protein [Pseudanabaenales cyanobacterium]|nr:DUF4277 domain-containing protein [Pseudanabaenales cyanobacterium]